MATDSNGNPIPGTTREDSGLELEVLKALLAQLVQEDLERYAETKARRIRVKNLGAEYLQKMGKKWHGQIDTFYIGPDVDNDKTIYVLANMANHPIRQMSRDGKRSSLRAKRTNEKRDIARKTAEEKRMAKRGRPQSDSAPILPPGEF